MTPVRCFVAAPIENERVSARVFAASRASNCTEIRRRQFFGGKRIPGGLKGTARKKRAASASRFCRAATIGIEVIFDQPVVRRDVGDESRPATMLRQNAWRCTDPGNSVLMPTMAIGSAVE